MLLSLNYKTTTDRQRGARIDREKGRIMKRQVRAASHLASQIERDCDIYLPCLIRAREIGLKEI